MARTQDNKFSQLHFLEGLNRQKPKVNMDLIKQRCKACCSHQVVLKLTSCSAIWTVMSAVSPDSRLGGGVSIALVSLCSASFRRSVMPCSSDWYARDTDSSFSATEAKKKEKRQWLCENLCWLYFVSLSVRLYPSLSSHRSPCWAAGPGSAAAPAGLLPPVPVFHQAWTLCSLCYQPRSRPSGSPGYQEPAVALQETGNVPDVVVGAP